MFSVGGSFKTWNCKCRKANEINQESVICNNLSLVFKINGFYIIFILQSDTKQKNPYKCS